MLAYMNSLSGPDFVLAPSFLVLLQFSPQDRKASPQAPDINQGNDEGGGCS